MRLMQVMPYEDVGIRPCFKHLFNRSFVIYRPTYFKQQSVGLLCNNSVNTYA